MAVIVGPPANSIRNRAITAELREVLNGAADANGIQRVVIFSGGQTDNHAANLKNVVGGWTGSRRHDNGRAADIHLIKDGNTLSFTNSNGSQVAAFITDVAARGANGIGAATDYMGPTSIHVGFGLSPSDTTKLTWGRAGASANAPMWLRNAARAGWNNPAGDLISAGRAIVKARGGLWLRRGPGLGFDRARLLAEGSALTIVGFDGEWARVDLEGDGSIDGHVFAAFLQTADSGGGGADDDGDEEMADEVTVAALIASPAAAPAAARSPQGARARRAARRRSGG
jgi:hypothetical protein